MTNKDTYLIKTVVGHLRYLRDEWDQEIEFNSIVRSSNVLRILLVDGWLDKAWRICGYSFPIRIRAFTLSGVLSEYGKDRDKIIVAHAGGALYKGIRAALGVWSLAEYHKDIALRGEELPLDKYLKSPCFIIRGVEINRVELIKYVANKLGGTHIDFNRKVNKPLEQKFLLLDSLHNYEKVDQNIIPYEILSIGQSIVGSRHVQRLMKRSL